MLLNGGQRRAADSMQTPLAVANEEYTTGSARQAPRTVRSGRSTAFEFQEPSRLNHTVRSGQVPCSLSTELLHNQRHDSKHRKDDSKQFQNLRRQHVILLST